jgi:hypothetical protein
MTDVVAPADQRRLDTPAGLIECDKLTRFTHFVLLKICKIANFPA